jgi:hypothetical protein
VLGLDTLGYASDSTLATFTTLNVFKCWPPSAASTLSQCSA